MPGLRKTSHSLPINLETRTDEEINTAIERIAEESDVEICRTCHAIYDGYGDGYDGECPECADKTEVGREATSGS
jgi:hypothetical protein